MTTEYDEETYEPVEVPEPELPLEEVSIVAMIGMGEEALTPAEIWKEIEDIKREIDIEGSASVDALIALSESPRLRRLLLSTDDLIRYDQIAGRAKNKLNEIANIGDLQQKIFQIVSDSTNKAVNE